MLETLQRDTGQDRATSPAIRSTGIILGPEYAVKAWAFVQDAKHEIRIAAYAWRWYDSEPELPMQKFNVALLEAVRRGVRVKAMVDTEAMAIVLRARGINARAVINTRMLHAKALVIDERTLVLGSHNLTKRATTDNYEVSVAIQEYEPVAQFITWFDALWGTRG